jgi:hypothetical protein
MTAIAYILLVLALIFFAGLSMGSVLLDREKRDEYSALVPILGIAGWITGLNLLFFITQNFALSAYVIFAVFIVLAVRAIRLKLAPPVSISSLIVLVVAFIFWVATLIPYILAGPGDYIGIFLGDCLNYSLIGDFYAHFDANKPFAPKSALDAVSTLALRDRTGYSLFAALPSWIAGEGTKAFLYPVNLLLNPLVFLSAFVSLRRLKPGGVAMALTLAALLFNNYYLFHAYASYSGKALGLPLTLAFIHLLHDALVEKNDKKSLALAGLIGSALAVTYWELFTVVTLVYAGLLAFNLTRRRLPVFFKRSIAILAILLLLAPNLYGILQFGALNRIGSSDHIDPFWDSMQLEPYLLFATGLHGQFPTLDHNKDDGSSKMARVDQWPRSWTELNREYASESWTKKRWKGSEDIYLSWEFLLLLSIFFFAGLVTYDRKSAYFTAVGRFTIIGGALFLLTKPTGKVFYNVIFYLSPFVFIVWGAGLDAVLRFFKPRIGRAGALILVPPLFYIALAAIGAVYMTYSSGRDADESALYTKTRRQYYQYIDSLKGLGEFVRANAGPEQRIVVMDKGPDAIKHAWTPLKYWLLYELKDYTTLFFNPGGHFGGLQATERDKEGSWLVYMYRPYMVSELDAEEKGGITFINDNFVVSGKELPIMATGFKQRPATSGAVKHFDGTGFLLYGAPPNLDIANIRQYTLEIWLKPEATGATQVASDTYPPMPALIEPLALYQPDDDALKLMFKTTDGESLFHTIEGSPSGRWVHLAVTVNRDGKSAIVFVNGKRAERFNNVEVPLGANVVLGKGYLQRFWKGDIGAVRGSSVERYGPDFDPTAVDITSDESTLFLF